MCRKLKISEHAQKSRLFKILIAIFDMAKQQCRAVEFASVSERIEDLGNYICPITYVIYYSIGNIIKLENITSVKR